MKIHPLVKITAAVSICAVAGAADRLNSGGDLRAAARSESKWTKTTLGVDGYQGSIEAYVTDKGTIRLAEIPGAFETDAELEMPDERSASAKDLADRCELNKGIFRHLKARKDTRYVLKTRLNPFASQTRFSRFAGNQAMSIENPVTVHLFQPKISLAPDAIAAQETRINTDEFNSFVSRQLDAQKSQVLATGKAELDLSGWDDVACDLASGKAVLGIVLKAGFESAKVVRKTVISGNDFSQVYGEVRKNWRARANVLENHVIGSALLAGSLVNRVQKPLGEIGFENYTSFHMRVFALGSGQLADLTSSDWDDVASELDVLSRGFSGRSLAVNARVSVKERR